MPRMREMETLNYFAAVAKTIAKRIIGHNMVIFKGVS